MKTLIARESLNQNSKKIEDDISSLKSAKGGRITKVFRVKDMISGSKLGEQEQVSIKDSISGELLVNESEIKKASLVYCRNVLTSREPVQDFKDEVESINKLHELRMLRVEDEDDYEKIVTRFKNKGKKSYQFLTKAGSEMHQTVFKFLAKVWKSEDIPDQWNMTTLTGMVKR